ncbi:MAG TPA: hypothetical protein VF389_00425 [Woeseiaceae bacterium]
MNRSIFAALLISTLCTSATAAQPEPNEDAKFFSWVRFGTQGFGAGAGYVLKENFAVRIGANTGDTFTGSRRIDDNRYDISRNTSKSFEALVDWHPTVHSGFRVTGGLMVMDTRTSLTARPDSAGNYILNGTSYTAGELGALSSEVRPTPLSPYLGIGWDSARPDHRGLRFVADVGMIHLRSSRASLVTANELNSDQFRSDLAAERSRVKAVNDLALGVSIGVSYSF